MPKKFQNDVSDKLVEKTQQKKNEKSLIPLDVYKVLILFLSWMISSGFWGAFFDSRYLASVSSMNLIFH